MKKNIKREVLFGVDFFSFVSELRSYDDIKKEWEIFYKDNYNLDVDLKNVEIPLKPKNSCWNLVFVCSDVTWKEKYNNFFVMGQNFFNFNVDDISRRKRKEKVYAIWVESKLSKRFFRKEQYTSFMEEILFHAKYSNGDLKDYAQKETKIFCSDLNNKDHYSPVLKFENKSLNLIKIEYYFNKTKKRGFVFRKVVL